MNNTKLTALNVGDIIGPLEVIDLKVDGGSLARYDGKVVFLDNAVPGDIVFAQLMENKKKIMVATVTEVVAPSSYRETPWCPYFSLCGGCSWQHISLDYQREWKKKHVKETLKRIGQIDIPVSSVLTSPNDSLTRTKISYVFSFSETIRIGLKQKKSIDVVVMPSCGLQDSSSSLAIALLLEKINMVIPFEVASRYLRYLIVHMPSHKGFTENKDNQQLLLEIITWNQENNEHTAMRELLKEVFEESALISGIVHSERISRSDVAQSEKTISRFGTIDLYESYGNTVFCFPYNGFMQTNTPVATVLYNEVRRIIHEQSNGNIRGIMDLYCGSGVIGLHALPKDASLTGVEVSGDSLRYAKKNAQTANVFHADFIKANIAQIATKLCKSENIDVILIDPPRSGVDQHTIECLSQSKASLLVYISCDVSTQARDIQNLCKGNWKAISSHPIDMFPHTPHIENIVVLTNTSK